MLAFTSHVTYRMCLCYCVLGFAAHSIISVLEMLPMTTAMTTRTVTTTWVTVPRVVMMIFTSSCGPTLMFIPTVFESCEDYLYFKRY